MKSLSLLLSLGLSASALAQNWQPAPACGGLSQYAIQRFNEQAQSVLQWDLQYQRSSSGSFNESVARANRDQAAAAALAFLSQPGALDAETTFDLEALSLRLDRGYQASRSGSAVETFYRQARQISWPAVARGLVRDSDCGSVTDWQGTLALAQETSRKYQQTSSGSLAETAYNQARTELFNRVEQKLQTSIQYRSQDDFRTFENDAMEFRRLYLQASSGSRIETLYRNGMDASFQAALRRCQEQASFFPFQELDRLGNEYDLRYRQASSGSRDESYFRQIRDILLQARLSPNPWPQPQPLPPPTPWIPQPPVVLPPPVVIQPPVIIPPMPQPFPPMHGSGWSCRTTTSFGVYEGWNTTQPAAIAKARGECLKRETAQVCNRAPVSCTRTR